MTGPALRFPGLLAAPLPSCVVVGTALCLKRFSLLTQKYINAVTFFSPLAWRCRTPHRVAFVEKLTKLVLSQLPNFWKLWISYVNGSLFSETAEKSGHIERSKNVRQRQNDFKADSPQLIQSSLMSFNAVLLVC
ncbi:EXOC2 [Cervus elaphus hippelaphus]|uniref:EXOC2 n=1 Tax=Cervus elaphus hippelaphus TaxID=46360 RepID=A0A212D4I4_CEREH|nr:EXOC2 [Cervus elaphus hippelaphus]